MEIPSTLMRYCPRCKTYTPHKVSIYKAGKRSPLKEGERRHARRLKGYGGSRKPIQKRFAKTTKKVALKLECTKCGMVIMTKGIRLRKAEVAR
ncbi:MAG: 50S ribosomal protein L44e [Candidatus Marsarchaeota archaeon]